LGTMQLSGKFVLYGRVLTGWPAVVFLILAVILGIDSGTAAGGGPQPASKPLAFDGQLVLSKTDRCPVCAMFPSRHPRSAAAMKLKNGATFYFCSNGCLLRAFLRPRAYLGVEREALDRLVVLDYFSGQPVDAHTATWVAGSDVLGPMGPAIIALAETGHIDAFKKRHGGNAVFILDRLDDDLWRKISRYKLPEP